MPRLDSDIARQSNEPLRPRERQETRVLIQRMYNRRAMKRVAQKLVGGAATGVGVAYAIAQLARVLT